MNANDDELLVSCWWPKPSGWRCYLFGDNTAGGLCFSPIEGQVPNRFWRIMQFLILGHRWVGPSK